MVVRLPNPLATGHSWQLGNLTTLTPTVPESNLNKNQVGGGSIIKLSIEDTGLTLFISSTQERYKFLKDSFCSEGFISRNILESLLLVGVLEFFVCYHFLGLFEYGNTCFL